MDQHLENVKWLLDALTPEIIDICCVAIASCTKSSAILKGVVSLIHNRAVLEPTICPLYAKLCSNLHVKLPTFPPEKAGGREVKFKPLLLQKCQEVFDGNVGLGQLGNVRLIGELLKQKMISEKYVHSVIERLLETDKEGRPTRQNAEAISELIRTVGKQLDESPGSRLKLDAYMNRLNKVALDAMAALGVYLKVHSIALLRENKWEEPNTQMVPAHSDSDSEESESEESLRDTNKEDDGLKRKTVRLLEEYFNVDKALSSVEELDSPWYHSEVVKEAICVGLEKCPPCTDQVWWLLELLFAEKVITADDVADGCLSYGSLVDGVGTPKSAARYFGRIMGKLVLAGGLDFGVVKEVLKRSKHVFNMACMFNSALRTVKSSPSPAAKAVLDAQASEIEACRLCFDCLLYPASPPISPVGVTTDQNPTRTDPNPKSPKTWDLRPNLNPNTSVRFGSGLGCRVRFKQHLKGKKWQKCTKTRNPNRTRTEPEPIQNPKC